MAATRVIRVHASRSIDVLCTPNCAATRCSAPRSRPAGSCSSSNPDRGAEPACRPPGSTGPPRRRSSSRTAERGIRVSRSVGPGRTPRDAVRRWALIDGRSGREAARWGSYESDAELLELPLDGSAGEPTQQLAYLVCTHSKHDTCCALRGRNVAMALHEVRPGSVWECSHVGGERFAANVLVLPTGLLYGRVLPFAAAEFVAAAEAGEVVGALLRGRIGLPPVGAGRARVRLRTPGRPPGRRHTARARAAGYRTGKRSCGCRDRTA